MTTIRVDEAAYSDVKYYVPSVTADIVGRYLCQAVCSNNAIYSDMIKIYTICKFVIVRLI